MSITDKDANGTLGRDECEHGSLRRKCNLCEALSRAEAAEQEKAAAMRELEEVELRLTKSVAEVGTLWDRLAAAEKRAKEAEQRTEQFRKHNESLTRWQIEADQNLRTMTKERDELHTMCILLKQEAADLPAAAEGAIRDLEAALHLAQENNDRLTKERDEARTTINLVRGIVEEMHSDATKPKGGQMVSPRRMPVALTVVRELQQALGPEQAAYTYQRWLDLTARAERLESVLRDVLTQCQRGGVGGQNGPLSDSLRVAAAELTAKES